MNDSETKCSIENIRNKPGILENVIIHLFVEMEKHAACLLFIFNSTSSTFVIQKALITNLKQANS